MMVGGQWISSVEVEKPQSSIKTISILDIKKQIKSKCGLES